MAATREEVYERVKEVLSEQLGVDENEITEEASFQEDLEADSLDLVELIMELEDAVPAELVPLVRLCPLGGPGGVREDRRRRLGGQRVDQAP